MHCGRISIGRLADTESGDKDTDGDKELEAAFPHGSDL